MKVEPKGIWKEQSDTFTMTGIDYPPWKIGDKVKSPAEWCGNKVTFAGGYGVCERIEAENESGFTESTVTIRYFFDDCIDPATGEVVGRRY